MTAGAAADDVSGRRLDGEAIEIRRRGGEVHAWCSSLGLHASAATADAALAELDRKLGELAAFEQRSGLDLGTRLGRPVGGAGLRDAWRRLGVPVLAGGLVALQLGWAISLGLSSGIGRALDARWRDSLVVSLERQILALAEPREDLSAEQQRRLVAAVRALKARYGPLWDEIVTGPR